MPLEADRASRYAAAMIRSLGVLTAALALTACTAAAASAASPGLKQVRDPGHVTGTIHGRCYYRDGTRLPDPRCTPGSVDPVVTQADIRSTICRSGWTDPHLRPPESQTERFKRYVAFPGYGLQWYRESELDHLVPLELGGSNDATNLWPELGKTSGNPKDSVENALHRAVCDGRVSLARAQAAIAGNWMTAQKRLGLGGTAGGGGGGGGGSSPWCSASAAPANDGYSGDYDVYVKSNQPNETATASDSGDTWSHETNGSGSATIYLWHQSPGESIKVTVGGATCWTSA
jgi:hypothetical protein